ncbi:Oleosin 16 kDa [Hibiscus syriacus]|uniref:Oleosin 16 kDa n=1 Tax=Hibiscus syriacus TaxID=106335 RepID=A0A6A3C123_HIBSY|nr:Oleosin 16 kDa [Hibiscus syriacus]
MQSSSNQHAPHPNHINTLFKTSETSHPPPYITASTLPLPSHLSLSNTLSLPFFIHPSKQIRDVHHVRQRSKYAHDSEALRVSSVVSSSSKVHDRFRIGCDSAILGRVNLDWYGACLDNGNAVDRYLQPRSSPGGDNHIVGVTGFLFSGGCGVAAITSLSWMYNYVQGKRPLGADQLDYAKNKLATTARDMTEKAKEYGQYVQNKAQEVTQGQGS